VFREPSPLVWLVRALVLTYGLAALVVLVLNYRHATVVSRRKLRVVVAGTVAGFLPSLVLLVMSFFVNLASLGLWAGRLLIFWAVLSLALVPLAFGYAIVRHQVIPIRLMIRRGVRYLLVSRGFYLVEAVVLVSVIGYLLSGSRARALDRLGGRADILATVGIGLGVFGLLQLANRRVMPLIDRRFFRDAYDAQRILAQVGDAARQMRSIDELLALAAARIEDALHPESIAVFLRDEASGHYAGVLPAGPAADQVSARAGVVEGLQRSPRTRDTELGGLVLPIAAKGDLLGMLSLGPRKGDLPYSRADRRLLEAIAWQLAYAIENARLVRRMAEEERLRREIAMASEVQKRLFPDRPPETRRLELAGVCHPAQGVGGDYYDFLDLGEGRVGVAVADVAGKGISAALLMSVVQASLRSQAGSVAPRELVASMNRLLYRSAARNRFATFFYAEFDERTGRLTYVNAGHNPPLLLRASAGGDGLLAGRTGASGGDGAAVAVAPAEATLVSLKTGGLVIGAMPATTYEQAEVDLASGDVLLAYTDGVTEAYDPAGDEYGEERLWDVVAASAHLPAAEMADAIVASVRRFCGDAPQYDDITLVAAKVR
jgi:sigma-B regulation protein RsbU (phosphoserine phosphatase)